MIFDPYLCAKDPVSRELNKTIVSSRSHINTLSTVLSTSSGLPPFWLLRLVLQLLLVEFTLAPPLPEFRFLESFFRATKKDRYVEIGEAFNIVARSTHLFQVWNIYQKDFLELRVMKISNAKMYTIFFSILSFQMSASNQMQSAFYLL